MHLAPSGFRRRFEEEAQRPSSDAIFSLPLHNRDLQSRNYAQRDAILIGFIASARCLEPHGDLASHILDNYRAHTRRQSAGPSKDHPSIISRALLITRRTQSLSERPISLT